MRVFSWRRAALVIAAFASCSVVNPVSADQLITSVNPNGGTTGTLQFSTPMLVGSAGNAILTAYNYNTSYQLQITFPGTLPANPQEFTPGASWKPGALGAASKNKNGVITPTSVKGTYSFTPTARGSFTENVSVTGQYLLKGKPAGAPNPVTVTLSGQGVAPVEQVTASSAGLTRIGASSTGSVVITNIGDGNLSKQGAVSNLKGSVGAVTGPSNFTFAGLTSLGVKGVGLLDKGSVSLNYTYTPTGHTSDQTSVMANFTNGSANGKNAASQVQANLTGQGVGPVYATNLAMTTDFGRVEVGHVKAQGFSLTNTSTDPNGGKHTLTDLSLLSYTITGANPNQFSLLGFKPGMVLAEGNTDNFTLDFTPVWKPGSLGPPGHWGDRSATITFVTDQGSAYGKAGATFSYDLTGVATLPEPGTLTLMALGGLGVAGCGWLRRKAKGQASKVS